MAKIVLVVEKKHNLLSMFIEKDDRSKNFVNQQSRDNKTIVKNYDALHVLSLFTGKEIKYLDKSEYVNEISGLEYFKFELPVSECGKYLLLDNPLASK